jgi:hypothetical protein
METYTLEAIKAIANLLNGSMSADEYRLAVQSGRLPRYSYDDIPFEDLYPWHPQTATNRGRRIAAADLIRSIAREAPDVVRHRIHHLHVAMFDCSAAVRLSLVKTIVVLSHRESIPVLEELAAQEVESPLVQGAVRDAIRTLRGELPLRDSEHLRELAT